MFFYTAFFYHSVFAAFVILHQELLAIWLFFYYLTELFIPILVYLLIVAVLKERCRIEKLHNIEPTTNKELCSVV